MNRLNHAKLAHRGRPTEMAFTPKRPAWHSNQAAKAASPARSASPEALAAFAAANGYGVAAR